MDADERDILYDWFAEQGISIGKASTEEAMFLEITAPLERLRSRNSYRGGKKDFIAYFKVEVHAFGFYMRFGGSE